MEMKKTVLDRRQLLVSAALTGLGATFAFPGLLSSRAFAQEQWKPERPIQVVIQFAAGGGTDTVIRTMLKEMEPVIGQRINATNMTGALGSVATRHVLSQPADGYTWLGAGGFLDYPRIRGIDTAITWKDFQFFQGASSIASWSVHPDSPFKTFQDLVDFAKANPGKLRVSTDGMGGLWHEAMALVSSKAGFEFTNVPYDGGAPATLAALQQEVDVAGSGLHEQIQYIRSGQLRHLAVFTSEPIDIGDGVQLEPVTKYVAEAAADAPFGADYNLALRRETPPEILQTVAEALRQAVASEAFTKMLTERFMQPTFIVGEEIDKKAARLETSRAALFAQLKLAEKSAADLGLPEPAGFDQWWPPEGYKPAM
jgi:tripartite-type tricarboxylate transporter receptor subunit TctC